MKGRASLEGGAWRRSSSRSVAGSATRWISTGAGGSKRWSRLAISRRVEAIRGDDNLLQPREHLLHGLHELRSDFIRKRAGGEERLDLSFRLRLDEREVLPRGRVLQVGEQRLCPLGMETVQLVIEAHE